MDNLHSDRVTVKHKEEPLVPKYNAKLQHKYKKPRGGISRPPGRD